ncbi:hypothetical protein MHYP_G00322560 [Metynnis hypsauchen]
MTASVWWLRLFSRLDGLKKICLRLGDYCSSHLDSDRYFIINQETPLMTRISLPSRRHMTASVWWLRLFSRLDGLKKIGLRLGDYCSSHLDYDRYFTIN